MSKFVTVLVALLLNASNAYADPRVESEDLQLTKYKPIFFLYGAPTTKLQFSFKYQLIRTWPLYIGYTQLMFWDLLRDSIPFRDINFDPELFQRISFNNDIFIDSVDLGYEHMSNGRDLGYSRSLHRVFAEIHMQNNNGEQGWEFNLRLRQILQKDHAHDQYDKYAGGAVLIHGRLTQVFSGIFDEGAFHFKIIPGGRWGEEWQYGSQEVGFSFRLGGLELAPSVFIQYFHGYAESMLNYRDEEQHLRGGILL